MEFGRNCANKSAAKRSYVHTYRSSSESMFEKMTVTKKDFQKFQKSLRKMSDRLLTCSISKS